MFTFSVFDRKYPFRANFFKKMKIISLSWNLLPRLIRKCRIQWWCSFYFILYWKCLFGQIWPKKTNCHFKLKLCSKTNSNMQNSMVILFCFFCDRKYPFCVNLVQKSKTASLGWNLVIRLIRIHRNQWWCSLFLFLTRNTLFRQICPKIQICLFRVKFDT